MANSFKRTSSSSSPNEEQNLEQLLQNWNPPKVRVSNVYHRKGIFEYYNPGYEIKTIEKTVSIQGEYGDFQLLQKREIEEHRRKYDSLHLGFVQVAVKPITRNGLNNSVLFCLRDCRLLRFNDSVLAIAESSLTNGPIYFNCFPSYSVSLKDPHILKVLTLNVKNNGLNRDEGSQDIAIVYKVHYKVMMDEEKPKSKGSLATERGTFIETNLLSSNVAAPRTIVLDSVEVPERWSARNIDHETI